MANSESKLESGFVKILVIITAISIGVNIILLLKRSEAFPPKKELITRNTELIQQVNEYRSELYKFKGISNKIDQVIKDANAKIEAKEQLIHQINRDNRISEKENKRLLFEVDSIRERYLNVIDSLLIERSEKRAINKKLGNMEDIIAEMNKQIGIASHLVGDNIKATPLKLLNNGSKIPTSIAKRAKEIEICLDILENKISRRGTKDLFFILTSPTGEILVDGGGDPIRFSYSEHNKQAECSKIGQVEYINKKLNYCTTINPGNTLRPGLYVLEIYTEENHLGMITFSLK